MKLLSSNGSICGDGRVDRSSPYGREGAALEQTASFTSGAVCSNHFIMRDAPLYSRQQVCSLVGVDTVLMGSWLRDGLLCSIDVGERKHRRFTRSEVLLGAFLREARKAHLNVSAMRALSAKVRQSVALYEKFSFDLDEIDDAQAIFEGWQSQEQFVSTYKADFNWQKRNPDHLNRVAGIIADFPFDRRDDWRIGWGLWHGTGLLMVWQTANGEWVIEDRFPQDERLPAASVIVFDVDRIAAIDWTQAGPA